MRRKPDIASDSLVLGSPFDVARKVNGQNIQHVIRGHEVFVYTVNRRDEINRLGVRGVDGVFTNDPELMIEK